MFQHLAQTVHDLALCYALQCLVFADNTGIDVVIGKYIPCDAWVLLILLSLGRAVYKREISLTCIQHAHYTS